MMSYCPECEEDKQSPWYDEYTELWVHIQKNSDMIVICNRINPDLDDVTQKTDIEND